MTKYVITEKICEQIMSLVAQGYNGVNIAKEIGVSESHYCFLKKNNPLVKSAINRGYYKSAAGKISNETKEWIKSANIANNINKQEALQKFKEKFEEDKRKRLIQEARELQF